MQLEIADEHPSSTESLSESPSPPWSAARIAPAEQDPQASAFRNLVYLVLALVTIVLAFAFPLSRFADYSGYLQLSDDYFNYYRDFKFWFEPVSSGMLVLARKIVPDPSGSIEILYRITEVAFFPAFIYVTRRYRTSTQGVLTAFAMSAPLLLFVTLRATPAYLLIWLATVQAVEGKFRSILTCLAASLFHFSSMLALGPVALCVIERRLSSLEDPTSVRRWITVLLAAVAAALFAARQRLNVLILDLVVNGLDKYATYVRSLDPITAFQGGLQESHLSHTIYLLAVAAVVVVFCLQKNEMCVRMRNLVIASFIIFLVLEFAPVTAYRYSIFWLVPVLFALPWNRFARNFLLQYLLVLGSIGLFSYEFYSCLNVVDRPDLTNLL